MTQGKPLKQLFYFALPLMFGNIFQQLYTVVDTAIVGQGVGLDALAAIGTVDWLNWMFLSVAQGFTQGFSVRISQKYGEQNIKGMKLVIGQSVRLSIAIAILGTLVSQAGLPLFLNLLKVPIELQAIATEYIRIIFAGFPIVVFYNYCASVLRAIGDSKTPLKAMVVASVTNIVLDLLAVFVWNLGVAGAACATVIAQLFAGIICVIKILKLPILHFGREEIDNNREVSVNLFKIGMPVAAQNIIISLGGMTVQMVANGFGMSFIAGFTATNKLYGLLEVAAISYGYAVTTYVGQNYGAGLMERIKKGIRSAVGLSITTSVIIAGIMILFGRQITMLFISSDVPELMEAAGNTAYHYLAVMSVCLPILYLLHLYQAALRGMGNTVMPMISGIIEFITRVSVSLAVGKIGFAYGLFGAEVAAWTGAMLFMLVSYYYLFKKECKSR